MRLLLGALLVLFYCHLVCCRGSSFPSNTSTRTQTLAFSSSVTVMRTAETRSSTPTVSETADLTMSVSVPNEDAVVVIYLPQNTSIDVISKHGLRIEFESLNQPWRSNALRLGVDVDITAERAESWNPNGLANMFRVASEARARNQTTPYVSVSVADGYQDEKTRRSMFLTLGPFSSLVARRDDKVTMHFHASAFTKLNRVITHNITFVVKGAPHELQLDAGRRVVDFAAVAALIAAPYSPVPFIMRPAGLTALLSFQCYSLEAYPVPWTLSPLQLVLGTGRHAYHWGLMVGNAVLGFGLIAAAAVLSLAISFRLIMSRHEAQGIIRVPGLPLKYYLFLYPGFVFGFARIISDTHQLYLIFPFLLFVAPIVLPTLFYILDSAEFRASFRPLAMTYRCEGTDDPLLRPSWLQFFDASSEWVGTDPARVFVHRFGDLFQCYTGSYYWHIVYEFSVVLITTTIAGLSTTTREGCISQVTTLQVVNVFQLCAAAYFQPLISRFDNYTNCLQLALQVVISAGVQLYEAGSLEGLGTTRVALVVCFAVQGATSLMYIAVAVYNVYLKKLSDEEKRRIEAFAEALQADHLRKRGKNHHKHKKSESKSSSRSCSSSGDDNEDEDEDGREHYIIELREVSPVMNATKNDTKNENEDKESAATVNSQEQPNIPPKEIFEMLEGEEFMSPEERERRRQEVRDKKSPSSLGVRTASPRFVVVSKRPLTKENNNDATENVGSSPLPVAATTTTEEENREDRIRHLREKEMDRYFSYAFPTYTAPTRRSLKSYVKVAHEREVRRRRELEQVDAYANYGETEKKINEAVKFWDGVCGGSRRGTALQEPLLLGEEEGEVENPREASEAHEGEDDHEQPQPQPQHHQQQQQQRASIISQRAYNML